MGRNDSNDSKEENDTKPISAPLAKVLRIQRKPVDAYGTCDEIFSRGMEGGSERSALVATQTMSEQKNRCGIGIVD